MVLPCNLKDNSDSTGASKRGKIQMLPNVRSGTVRNNKTTTQRYVTASINVGSINYEHAWYIAKMEGIVTSIWSCIFVVHDYSVRSIYLESYILYGFAFNLYQSVGPQLGASVVFGTHLNRIVDCKVNLS